MRATLATRFWAKVVQSEGCWRWTGAKTGDGYGVIGNGGRKDGVSKAPRVSWALHFGAIPEGLIVCHRCDNPECTNPAHLFLGTYKDNSHDAKAKGRMVPPPRMVGAANFKSKMLTFGGETHCIAEWGRRLGVKGGTISHRLCKGWSVGRALGFSC